MLAALETEVLAPRGKLGEGGITGCAAVGACIGGGQALHLSNK